MHCFSNIPDFAAHLFTTFPVLHRIAGMEPTPFSPSPLIPSFNSIQHKVSSGANMFSTCLSFCLMLPASLKGKKLLRCHTEMILRLRRAWRGMLRVMIPGGECTWFDAEALTAYQECPAQDQEDRRCYRRRRRCFQCSLCISTCPPSAQLLQPRTRSVYLTFTNSTSSPTYPSQPFVISFLRLSPPLPQTQGWVHDSADSKIAFLWGR